MKTTTAKEDQHVALIKIADQLFHCLDLLHSDWKKSSNFEALQAGVHKQAKLFRLLCAPYTCQTEPPLPEQVNAVEQMLECMQNSTDIMLKWLQGPNYYSVADYTASVIARAELATKPAAVKPKAKKPIARTTKRKR